MSRCSPKVNGRVPLFLKTTLIPCLFYMLLLYNLNARCFHLCYSFQKCGSLELKYRNTEQEKKAKEGELYMQKEREKNSRYYVPVKKISKKDKKSRKDVVKQKVKLRRYRKHVGKQGLMETNKFENLPSTSSADVKSTTSASNVQPPRLVVKMPTFDPEQRSRRITSREDCKKSS